jgi:hypothetical protein
MENSMMLVAPKTENGKLTGQQHFLVDYQTLTPKPLPGELASQNYLTYIWPQVDVVTTGGDTFDLRSGRYLSRGEGGVLFYSKVGEMTYQDDGSSNDSYSAMRLSPVCDELAVIDRDLKSRAVYFSDSTCRFEGADSPARDIANRLLEKAQQTALSLSDVKDMQTLMMSDFSRLYPSLARHLRLMVEFGAANLSVLQGASTQVLDVAKDVSDVSCVMRATAPRPIKRGYYAAWTKSLENFEANKSLITQYSEEFKTQIFESATDIFTTDAAGIAMTKQDFAQIKAMQRNLVLNGKGAGRGELALSLQWDLNAGLPLFVIADKSFAVTELNGRAVHTPAKKMAGGLYRTMIPFWTQEELETATMRARLKNVLDGTVLLREDVNLKTTLGPVRVRAEFIKSNNSIAWRLVR